MTAFQFPRHNFPLRMSQDLDSLVSEAADALRCTKTDICIYAVAQFVDPSGLLCPDVEHLPATLRGEFRTRTASEIMTDLEIA